MPEIRTIRQVTPEQARAISIAADSARAISVHTEDAHPEHVVPKEVHVVSVNGDVARPIHIDAARIIYEGGEPYEGPYTVTPKVSSQQLATAHKLMTRDVTVLEIPYYETSNINGITVYIADQL